LGILVLLFRVKRGHGNVGQVYFQAKELDKRPISCASPARAPSHDALAAGPGAQRARGLHATYPEQSERATLGRDEGSFQS